MTCTNFPPNPPKGRFYKDFPQTRKSQGGPLGPCEGCLLPFVGPCGCCLFTTRVQMFRQDLCPKSGHGTLPFPSVQQHGPMLPFGHTSTWPAS